jgi:hypothetical protein
MATPIAEKPASWVRRHLLGIVLSLIFILILGAFFIPSIWPAHKQAPPVCDDLKHSCGNPNPDSLSAILGFNPSDDLGWTSPSEQELPVSEYKPLGKKLAQSVMSQFSGRYRIEEQHIHFGTTSDDRSDYVVQRFEHVLEQHGYQHSDVPVDHSVEPDADPQAWQPSSGDSRLVVYAHLSESGTEMKGVEVWGYFDLRKNG